MRTKPGLHREEPVPAVPARGAKEGDAGEPPLGRPEVGSAEPSRSGPTTKAQGLQPPTQPPPNLPTPPPGDLGALRKELAEARDRAAAMQKALDEQRKERLYLQAEFDNFRKQKMREFDELRQFAAERVVSTLIDDMENLQRLQDHAMKEISQAEAAGAAPDPLGRIRSLHEGVQRVTKHLVEALAATGLREMAAQGADFDPAMHEALAEEARADCRDHEVLQVFQKGYTMHGRVLRPAKVLVGRRTEPKRTQPGAEPGESPEAREGEPPREHPIQENDQKE